MKAIFAADLHLKKDSADILKRYIKRVFEENEVDYFFLAGDFLHSPASLGSDIESEMIDILDLITNNVSFENVYLIKGTHSHDGNYLHSKIITDRIPKDNIITDIQSQIIAGLGKVLFIPEDPKIEDWVYQKFLSEKHDFIVGHGTVEGYFKINEEMIERPSLSQKVFSLDDFKNAKYTFFGHYHEKNFVSYNHDKNYFCYIGSTITNNFGEISSTKGFILFDDSKKLISERIKTIKNPFDRLFYQRRIRKLDDYDRLKGFLFEHPDAKVRPIIDDATPEHLRKFANAFQYKKLETTASTNGTKELIEKFSSVIDMYEQNKSLIEILLAYIKKLQLDQEIDLERVRDELKKLIGRM